MAERRYDMEPLVSAALVEYVKETVDPAILKDCPAVTFYDPMSVDDASRIVIQCHEGETLGDLPANFNATVECVVRSQWCQETLPADLQKHWDRVNKVRDTLFYPAMVEGINAKAVALAVTWVAPRRGFHTSIMEGWAVSTTTLTLKGHFTDKP
jgi:hypothetical protein